METKIRDINRHSPEGKLLLASLAMVSAATGMSPQQALEKARDIYLKAEQKTEEQ